MQNELNIERFFKNKFNFFVIIILLIILSSTLSQEIVFNYRFIKIVELIDENYIMCTEKNINIFDSNFKNLIFQHNLTTEIPDKDTFEFVTISQYPNEDGGRIIVLYKNKVYLIYSSYSKILQDNININHQNSKYYTLVPYKDGDNYNFIIGYIDNIIKLAYYKFNIGSNSVELINTFSPDLPCIEGRQEKTSYEGFSCNIMISNQKGKVLTCFYEKIYIFGVCSFNLVDFNMIEELCHLTNSISPSYIHSAVSFDKGKSLICFINGNANTGHCINYDINKHELSSVIDTSEQCNRDPASVNVFYSIKSKEFLFLCYDYSYNYHIVKYNETLSIVRTENTLKIDNCDPQFVSIIYDYNNNTYNSFLSCGDYKKIKYYPLPNTFNPSEKPIWPEFPLILDTDSHSQINTQTNSYSISNLASVTDSQSQINTQTNSNSVLISTSVTDSQSQINTQTNSNSVLISSTVPVSFTDNHDINNYIIINDKKECSGEFLYENKNTGECLKTCDYSEILNKNCLINTITNDNIGEITKEIRNIIKNANIDSNTNILIEGENIVYQIISSQNMNDNNNNNLSIIDFGDCENILKEENNIDYLIILKIDIKVNINSPNILNYEIYNPKSLEKLNLSLCRNVTINTYINFYPSKEALDKIIKLNESGFDLYNINDSFYQDLCTPFTSDDGTDILLSDRKNDFYENISLCETGCTYLKYDYITQRVKCECPVKNEIDINEKKEDKDNFFSNFIDEDTFSNIKVLKCFKLVFSKKGHSNNIGSYIFLILIFSLIVLSVIYRIYQIRNIMRILRKIIKVENFIEKINNENKSDINKNNNLDNNNFNNNTNNNKPNDNNSINNKINIMASPLKKKKESKKYS